MGIFDDVVSSAKAVASNVGKKAEKLVDLSKLKITAAELESDISKKYQTLGKLTYNASKDPSLSSGIDSVIEEIDGLKEALDAVEEETNYLCNKKACPNCKKLNDAEAAYCSACGTLLPVIEEDDDEVIEEAQEAAEEAAEEAEEVKEDCEEKTEE